MIQKRPFVSLEDAFLGCLLGLAVGDALGGCFEGQSADSIARRYPSPQALMDSPPLETLHYTDDTQMAIGVAEALIEDGAIREETLCRRFASNYVPSRGYGFGTRRVLEVMSASEDYRAAAEAYYPGGSFGNGAAMRVAPVGLLFHDDLALVSEQARLSALTTHLHPLAIEGARLLALGVGLLVRAEAFDRSAFFAELLTHCQLEDYQIKLERASRMRDSEEVSALGNGIQALESVPTALACFAFAPEDYGTAIGRAILLGGDTDTIAAMTGALSGTFLGVQALPSRLLARLEDDAEGKGRTYLTRLAEQLQHRERHTDSEESRF
jgi:poly(ADP-ribose) glycohydrolase ARH3